MLDFKSNKKIEMCCSDPSRLSIRIGFFSKDKGGYAMHFNDSTDLEEILNQQVVNTGDIFCISKIRSPSFSIVNNVTFIGDFPAKSGFDLFSCISVDDDREYLLGNLRQAIVKIYSFVKKYENAEVSFLDGKYVEEAIFSLGIASYSFRIDEKNKSKMFLVNSGNKMALEIAQAQNFARSLGDSPANLMTPTLFSEYAKDYLSEFLDFDSIKDSLTCNESKSKKVDFKIFDKNFLIENKLNLILGVSQGSSEEPKLLHMKYFGADDKKIKIALVGKGVTFDTGGISLKPSKDMYKLKEDMMGAAILLALFKLAVSSKLKINISATFPMVENMINGKATKPGDVHVAYRNDGSTISVAVDNTDAEGRLILGDAILFAQRDDPEYVIDAATLTGAVKVALGNVAGAYCTNDNELSKIIYESGEETNEMLWRMPLSPYYKRLLKNHCADMSNIGNGTAGVSVAAEFIHEFVDKSRKWAHFDISGIRNSDFTPQLYGKEATGRPLRAFYRILEKLQEK